MKIKREMTSRQRDAMIRRKMALAESVRRNPSIALDFDPPYRADDGRPQVVVERTHAKRGRRGYRLTPAMRKEILTGTAAQRRTMLAAATADALMAYLHWLGKAMTGAVRRRIAFGTGLKLGPTDKDSKPLNNTGAMVRSLIYRIRMPGGSESSGR